MAARNALVLIAGVVREMPAGDTLNGAGGAARQFVVAREEQTSGTSGGTPSAGSSWLTRVLNTLAVNTITGASLSSNQITLPAGTYQVHASGPAYRVDLHKARLYNVTGSAVLIVGTSEYSINDPAVGATRSFVRGVFTLSGTSAIRLEQFFQTAVANGQGRATSASGVVEVYSEILIEKVG